MALQTTLPVTGLSCASCAGRVERALLGVKGVDEAAVNLARKTVTISHDPSVGLTDLTDSLSDAGYPAGTQETRLNIAKMSCASCSGRVARGLTAAPGVVDAQVNLATHTASIRFVPGLTSPTELAHLVTEQGYPAEVHMSDTLSTPADQTDEIAHLQRLVVIAALLTLPVFVVEMGGHLMPAFHHWVHQTIGMQTSRVLQFLLTSAVLFGPGRGLLQSGFSHLARATPEMNALVALGSTAAYGYSVLATFAPALLPAAANHVYFEAAAVIITLILTGRWLEARAKGRTGAAITRLIGLRSKTARVLRGESAIDLPIEDIVVGDILQLRPGEVIATDGVVLSGQSFVDESMVTGEPVPVAKQDGAALVGGTINGTGTLTFRASKVGKDTMLAQIIAMVEQAQGAKLPIQGLVDRITLWFVPAVLMVAVLTMLVWLLFGPDPVLSHALVAGVAVLIIACPCAMGLATPTSVMVGTGRAAELGVLFRKGDALQRLNDCTVVAFDKTGTLTQGRPELVAVTPLNGFDEAEILRLAASVETVSEHPIAQAITRAAAERGLRLAAVEAFQSETGFGVSARVAGAQVLVGADRFMARQAVDLGQVQAQADAAARLGQTPLFVAKDGVAAAMITVADPVKSDARDALDALRERGVTTAMLTGDNNHTAQAIAAELGIDHVVAELLPEGKTKALERLRAQVGPVAFIGDGINDAPALAAADVGLAIGTGSDVAIETGDVVLISGRLIGVERALEVSQQTLRNIKQNLFWAFGYNIVLIPVAAGALYPAFGLQLSPMLGAGAMALSSVFVLSNALRLRFVAGTITPKQKKATAPSQEPVT